MSSINEARAALRGRILANRFVAGGMILLLLLTVFFGFRANRLSWHVLRISAGDSLSHRYQTAEILCDEALKHGLELKLSTTNGSQASLTEVAEGKLDVALVLGDFDFSDEHIREVAVLNSEPMHLFVKPELIDRGLTGLRGATLSLSSAGSNSHKVARQLLRFVGLAPGVDYQERNYSHQELKTLTAEELPDGIFVITALPWTEVGEMLVHKFGYRLMELPFADAMALRDPSLHDTIIPAYSYSIDPAVPAAPLHTVGQHLLVVANRSTSEAAVVRLMKVLFEGEFARRARFAVLDPNAVDQERDFPLHPGTLKYLNRNEPLIKADMIDKLENLRSFLMSGALAIFLFWRWHKRRNLIGFETYIDSVSELEMAALTMERGGQMDYAELHRLRQQLSEIKGEALERQAEGVLTGEDQMASFLTHVADVRGYLDSLLAREPLPPVGAVAAAPSTAAQEASLSR